MPEKRTKCVMCDASLEQPATGRPAVYCSTACRRLAENERRRLTRHLEHLDRERTRYRLKAATWGADRDRELAVLDAEVEAATARLRDLLDH